MGRNSALESHCRCLTLVSRNHCRSRVLANHFEDCTVPSARTMQSMQEHARTRPRVSRACERCRIKKAKCDGERPCRRCNLDSAVCSFKVRRKPESASATQRYTNLLLQHHSALTAGVLKLYSKMLHAGQWEGSPVKEVNGSPSVHCILERIGVIGSEEDFDDNVDVETRRERPDLAPIQETRLTSKANKSPKKGVKKPSEARILQRPISPSQMRTPPWSMSLGPRIAPKRPNWPRHRLRNRDLVCSGQGAAAHHRRGIRRALLKTSSTLPPIRQ